MRTILLVCFTLASFISKSQFVSIPDANFRNYLISNFPSCFNASQQMDTTCNGIVNAAFVDVGSISIADLDGIQYFDNLVSLDASFNLLSSLPSLPNSLTTLVCNHNLLSNLPALPNITTLNCSNNLIITLSNLSNVITLNCESNQLTSLPNLPIVTSLKCGGNHLTTLPALPSILYLYCNGNQFQTIPSFPNLLYLNCRYNQLISLPILPNTLSELWCDNNFLISLPELPNSLTQLFCGTNLITQLPALPNSLNVLFVEGNKLLECLPSLPASLTTLVIAGSGITCVPNHTNLMTSFPLCGSNCIPHASCSGIIFLDFNINGNYDAGIDQVLDHHIVSNSTFWTASSSKIGEYQMKLDSGVVNTLTVNPVNSILPYATVTPLNYTLIPNAQIYVGNNYNFAIQLMSNVQDLQVGIANGFARPGFNQWVYAFVNNIGTVNVNNATLKVLKPSSFNFISSSPLISAQHGDTLIWNNFDVNLLENKNFSIYWNIPWTVPLGTPYQIEAWILPILNDTTAADNHAISNGITTASFDPNGKEVNKTELLRTELSEELNYTVHFQNTGTDTAFTIIVRDQLSSNVDISSFKMLGASHSYDFLIRENGLLEVFFQNIQLVDSVTNEPESHGFFQYSIKPKANLKEGDIIGNSASIYFDYNSPILTDTVFTSIVYPNGIDEWASTTVELYPNPTTGKATIHMSTSSAMLTISDLNGRVLYEGNTKNDAELDFTSYADGIYIGRIKTPKGFAIFKIVKQH